MTTMTKPACLFNMLFVLLATVAIRTFADQVVMQNGDRYNGKVLSVSPTNVFFQSEVLGVVNLSRVRVANLTMGVAMASTNSVAITPASKTNTPPDFSAALSQLGNQSNLVNQVRSQFLATANPEANQKFDQILNDLGTGKMSIADLRSQAKAAANQLRQLEKEGGEDSSGSVGLYLSILDNFLAETETTTSATTNSAVRKKP